MNLKIMQEDKMIVEIWSDIMCPFCYIGKRKFDNALAQFSKKDNVQVIWKSFDLAPTMETNTAINIYEFLQIFKKISMQQVKTLTKRVTTIANEANLDFNFDKVVVAKTMKTHQLMHLAEKKGLQSELKEVLLKAYFIDGQNVDDLETLILLGTSVGLNSSEIKNTIENGIYLDAIESDLKEARALRVQGIPYFVFNKKNGVSGAQHESTFLDVLEKSYHEWENLQKDNILEVIEGDRCDVNGNC